MDSIKKVALAVIKDRKVIMVRSKKHVSTFFTLGGKIESGETDVECLRREVKEEVNSDIDNIEFLNEFENEAFGQDEKRLIIRLYKGKLLHEPCASSEIAEIKYFDSSADKEVLTKMGKQIVTWLKDKDYID